MGKDANERLTKIEKEIKELPEKAQQAIRWIIKNFDFVEKICKNSDMADEEIEKRKEAAMEKEDYTAFALLCISAICHEMQEEEEEEEKGVTSI